MLFKRGFFLVVFMRDSSKLLNWEKLLMFREGDRCKCKSLMKVVSLRGLFFGSRQTGLRLHVAESVTSLDSCCNFSGGN